MSNTTTVVNYLIESGYLAAAATLAGSAIKYGKSVLDAKTAQLTANIKNESVKNAVNTAEDCVSTVVSELSQTTVETLKAKAADGKLTAADAAEIKATAFQKAQALMSDDVIHTLNTLYGDAEVWTNSKIEAAVKALKVNMVSTAPAATAVLQSTAKLEEPASPADDTASNETPAADSASSAAEQTAAAPQNITVNVTVPANATQDQIVAAVQTAQASETVQA